MKTNLKWFINVGTITLVFLWIAIGAGAYPLAYIPNSDDGTVSVIDGANNILNVVPVGQNPQGVVLNQKFAYITNYNDNTVSVINTTTNAVTDTIPVGNLPLGIAASPDGKKVYVANSGSGNISVINTATNTVTSIDLPSPQIDHPKGVAATNGRLYVSVDEITIQCSGATATSTRVSTAVSIDACVNGVPIVINTGYVDVIDTTVNPNTVIATIEVGDIPDIPAGILTNHDGTKVYVTNAGSSTNPDSSSISVIDATTNSVTNTITIPVLDIAPFGPVFMLPFGVVLSIDGTKLYVSSEGQGAPVGSFTVIDTVTNSVTTSLPMQGGPEGVSITPLGLDVYMADIQNNVVDVIDTSTNSVTTTVPVGMGPVAFGQFINQTLLPWQKIRLIEAHVTRFALPTGQTSALIATLDAAVLSLTGIQSKKTPDSNNAAIGSLNAFNMKAMAYAKAGILKPEQAQGVVNAANTVIEQIKNS